MLLTAAPLAIVVVMMVVIYYQAQRRSADPKPMPLGFWIWLAAAAAFIGVTMWQAHLAGTPLLPKGGLGQVGPYLIMAVMLVVIWRQMQARVRRTQAGLPPVPPASGVQIWVRWIWLAILAAIFLSFIFESIRRK